MESALPLTVNLASVEHHLQATKEFEHLSDVEHHHGVLIFLIPVGVTPAKKWRKPSLDMVFMTVVSIGGLHIPVNL